MLDWDETAFGSDERAKFLDPALHHMALSALAAQALQAGKLEEAFILADRRCRISPTAEANDYLLKAEAARRLGRAAIAEQAIEQAIDIDPTAELVNLHALRLPDLKSRIRAAEAIIANPNSSAKAHRVAVSHLEGSGRSIFGSTRILDNRVVGWLTWPQGRKLEGTIRYGSEGRSLHLLPDPHHPLSTQERHAATLEEPCSKAGRVDLAFWCSDSLKDTYEAHFLLAGDSEGENCKPRAHFDNIDHASSYVNGENPIDLAILIPVYGDAEATRRCLDSVEAQTSIRFHWRIIVVSDASPNRVIVSDLRDRAQRGSITLIENEVNLGFAASINKAAATASEGSLLLLNADAFLPQGCLDRLLQLANATSKLGTLTPLSNNGVVTSFPKSFDFNELPDNLDLTRWDVAAIKADLAPIDLLHGIGFCLLVTRQCWEAIGGMSLAYGQGYYEDVELCLRARDLGFRNLCATTVFVAHAGSRSFGPSKRALVVENAKRLEERFPGFHVEYNAFRRADPLRSVYGQIERFIAPAVHDTIIISFQPAINPAFKIWFSESIPKSKPHLLATVLKINSGWTVNLRSETGGIPQSLTFEFAHSASQNDLREYFYSLSARNILIAEPWLCPSEFVTFFSDLGIQLDLLISEKVPSRAALRGLSSLSLSTNGHEQKDIDHTGFSTDFKHLLDLAAVISCTDMMAFYYMQELLEPTLQSKVRILGPRHLDLVDTIVTKRATSSRRNTLCVLCPTPHADVHCLVKALSVLIRTQEDRFAIQPSIVVAGTTLNDLSLISNGRTFVTGPIDPTEMTKFVDQLSCDLIILPYRSSHFHSVEALSQLPSRWYAYFDWSGGTYKPKSNELALNPEISDSVAAIQILDWLATVVSPAS